MIGDSLSRRELLLIGAGHTHLHVVRMWRMRPIPETRLTLVSAFSRATYSGMLPGTLAGLYQPGEMEIDLYRLAPACNARLIVAPVVGLNPETREVQFADRPPLRFDIASIGIGSVPRQAEIWRASPRVLSIKPMPTFLERLQAALREFARPCLQIVVVGAGAAGTEISCCLHAFLQRHKITARLTLLDGHPEILPGYASRTARLARQALAHKQIAVVTSARVTSCRDTLGNEGAGEPALELELDDGRRVPADLVIWTVGAAAPAELSRFQLPQTDDGFLAVRDTLQTTADFPVFAVGDTAGFVSRKVPKAGVYAVREGPVLFENLHRLSAGKPLRSFRPQHGFLSLLSTGDARAIFEYRGISVHARWAWQLKDRIDRGFLQKHDPACFPAMKRAATQSKARELLQMRCAGCGGKVGAEVLAAALARLDLPRDSRLLQGLQPPQDAAVLDGAVLAAAGAPVDVLSVDFFRSFVDDPYLVGRVSALNSLSDLWATGARPQGALALVTLPPGGSRAQGELLFQLLAGGVRELQGAGAFVWGGHTTEGPELTIGWSVAGALHGAPPFGKQNLSPGDRLILTKPLGTGTLLAAFHQGAAKARWLDAAFAVMLTGNAAAAGIARAEGLRAVTDVTGFGLAGHLCEMLAASGAAARLSLSRIPLLEGVAELTAAGIRSTLEPANRLCEKRFWLSDNRLVKLPQYAALFDPQTSGGLLLSVPSHRSTEILRQLHGAGYADAAEIGEVRAPARGALDLELEA